LRGLETIISFVRTFSRRMKTPVGSMAHSDDFTEFVGLTRPCFAPAIDRPCRFFSVLNSVSSAALGAMQKGVCEFVN
jgi:hypothetical protein